MIKSISTFFTEVLTPEDTATEEELDKTIQFATAALMMEVSRADNDKSLVEREQVLSILNRLFQFDPEDIQALIDVADEATDEAHDLFTFTSLINQHYAYDQKLQLMINLWLVAYADGRLDSFEEHIIRRIAGLIYVDHQDFIRTKIEARDKGA